MTAANLITLTTDFGLQDPYVGQVKGAILRHNPTAGIIDLTHAIQPHDILAAAVTIRSSYHSFPKGSVHLVVVDPGVGSQRNIIALQADDHYFVAPDNGCLTFLLRDRIVTALHRVENRSLFPTEISDTFHGRDIMAPIAAALAGGLAMNEVGPKTSLEKCVQLDIPLTHADEHGITGRVIYVDRFGNIRTSITSSTLARYQPAHFSGIFIGQHRINAISSTYSDVGDGTLLAVIDSAGHLEIAVNRGSAAEITDCRIGDAVTVSMENKE